MKKDNKTGELEENKKNKNIFIAIGHAIDGVICAFKTERNLKIDYLIGLLVLVFSLFFDFSKTEFACLCLTIGFVIFAEMINSTVEYMVDLITEKYDERAKAAKDIAAGGVLVASLVSVVVAYFLFADKIYRSTSMVITTILQSKAYLFFTIIFAVVILSIILKGLFSKEGEKEYSKSPPSLRVCLAFALTTYTFVITKSIISGVIALSLSIIISQIRYENKKAKAIHIAISAMLGILLVLIVNQLMLFRPEILQLFEYIFP